MTNRDNLFSYLLSQIQTGQLDKTIAANIISLYKQSESEKPDNRIAIIGVGARLGAADNEKAIREMLFYGVDAITEFPESRRNDAERLLPLMQMEKDRAAFDPCGYMSDIDRFDPAFFQLSPREASLMDPNQRLFLQTAWEAVEEAGYGGRRLAGTHTGVFVGFSSDFGEEYKRGIQNFEPESVGLAIPGNIKSIIASRISYFLDLKGPAIVIDTACSSSLVAVHMACKQIIEGSCDMALAGGVKINLFPLQTGTYSKIGIESSNERTRTFDDESDGTGKGEGVGVILLKPLSRAIKDGDHIHGIIRGSAINQDGHSIGITAPDPSSQEDVICRAWEDAGIDPEQIAYIEAHGTGTKLGDPIEAEGLIRAFSRYTSNKQFCAIGSIKTNIGHLDHAAGIAGLLKVLYSFKHGRLFPNVHFGKPNRNIDFSSSPVYVNDQLREWVRTDSPRIAGVSSFGLSGTNCHMVLEEPPQTKEKRSEPIDQHWLLPLSAIDQSALLDFVASYIGYLIQNPGVDMEDLCRTAGFGRGHYAHRLAIVCSGYEDLLHKLLEVKNRGLVSVEDVIYRNQELASDEASSISVGKPVDLSDYRTLGKLYVSGAEIDWLTVYDGAPIQWLNLPTYPFQSYRCWFEFHEATGQAVPDVSERRDSGRPLLAIQKTERDGQTVYSRRYAQAEDWALNEHRVGSDYVLPGTAYIELLLEVGRAEGGWNVILDLAFLQPFILGEGESAELRIQLQSSRSGVKFLVSSEDPIDGSSRNHAEGTFDRVEGAPQRSELKELRSSNRFHHRISDIQASGPYIVTGPRWDNLKELDVGHNECLARLELPDDFTEDLAGCRLHPALLDNAVNVAIRSIDDHLYLPFYYEDIRVYGPILGEIYSYVQRKDNQESNRETAVFDIQIMNGDGDILVDVKGYTIKRIGGNSLSNLYYEQDWVAIEPPVIEQLRSADDAVLLLLGEGDVADRLAERIHAAYRNVEEATFADVASKEQYSRLLERLASKNVRRIFHCFGITGRELDTAEQLADAEARGFYSVYYLVDSLVSLHYPEIELVLLTDDGNRVTGEERHLRPQHGCLYGMGKVLRDEYPSVKVRHIDLDKYTLPDAIVREIEAIEAPYLVSYRNGERYAPRISEAKSPPSRTREAIKAGGVYVITGGTGGLGLEIAKHLSRTPQVKLHLLSRSGLPEQESWESIVGEGRDLKRIRQIASVQEMTKNGSEVYVHAVDVKDEAGMMALFERIRASSGGIQGVVHCAGIAGEKLLIHKEESRIREVLGPKVAGTWVLDRATLQDNLDFFVLFSSVNSLIGGMGQGDYAAANGYLDVYGSYMRLKGRKAVTINWPLWRDIGMGVDYKVDDRNSLFASLSPQQGLNIFTEIIGSDAGDLIVGELKRQLGSEAWHARIAHDYRLPDKLLRRFEASGGDQTGSREEVSPDADRFVIVEEETTSLSATEKELAAIWAQVLGIRQFSVMDKFTSLGGNSIFAIELFRKLEAKYGSLINVSDVFTYATVSEMANYLDNKRQDRTSGSEMTDELALLQRLANRQISLGEALNAYNKTNSGGSS